MAGSPREQASTRGFRHQLGVSGAVVRTVAVGTKERLKALSLHLRGIIIHETEIALL